MVGVFLPPNDQTYESQLVQILSFVRMEKPRELETTNQMTFDYHQNFYRPFLLLLTNPRHWKTETGFGTGYAISRSWSFSKSSHEPHD